MADKKPLSPLQRAKAYAARRSSFKRGRIAFGEKGWHYHWFSFSPNARGQQKAELLRFDLRERGYEAVTGPNYEGEQRKETVVGVPTAEIWRCPKEVADFHFGVRLKRNLANETWRRFQEGRIKSTGAFVPSLTG